MSHSFDPASASPYYRFVWVDLTGDADASLAESLDGAFDIHRVREPARVAAAICDRAPAFVCFEFDEPNAQGVDALTRVRRDHPALPVLVIAGRNSMAVAMWALRLRVWDLLIKPVPLRELCRSILALASMTRSGETEPARPTLSASERIEPRPAFDPRDRQKKTQPAISYVSANFNGRIALDHVAALCQLSPSQFCRTFRQEHGVSFGQYLLRYRMERACERLAHPDALVKEVAYSVGCNDLSYFTRVFRRQFGVCPSVYQAGARSSCTLEGSP
jgi:two-component system, response regulator YesN